MKWLIADLARELAKVLVPVLAQQLLDLIDGRPRPGVEPESEQQSEPPLAPKPSAS